VAVRPTHHWRNADFSINFQCFASASSTVVQCASAGLRGIYQIAGISVDVVPSADLPPNIRDVALREAVPL
jgi:hypothetical protein